MLLVSAAKHVLRVDPARALNALCVGYAELPRSIALVVAHPDDEVIGVGGRLACWVDRTVIVHVTDGAPPDCTDARRAGFTNAADYARARRRETWTALACLPRQPIAFVPLGFTDQRVTHQLFDLVTRLRKLFRVRAPEVVVTHAYEGGHPDHDAVAFAVQTARASAEVPAFHVIEFAEYHENAAGALVTNRFARCGEADGRIASALTPQDRRRKQLMLRCFGTQRRVLDAFRCDEEWLRPAPEHDFARPPAHGRVLFDRFNWGVTSDGWRALVAEASRRLAADGVTC